MSEEPRRLLRWWPTAAEALGLSRTGMYHLLKSGELPSIKLGKLRFVAVTDLDDYVARKRQEAGPFGVLHGPPNTTRRRAPVKNDSTGRVFTRVTMPRVLRAGDVVEERTPVQPDGAKTITTGTPCCEVDYRINREDADWFVDSGRRVWVQCGKNLNGRGNKPGEPGCGWPYELEFVPWTPEEPDVSPRAREGYTVRWHVLQG